VVVPAADAGRFVSGARSLPWLVLAAATIVALADPALTATAAPWPFVIALAVFGMPHGAADWSVAASLSRAPGFRGRLAGFVGYLAWMGASLALIVWQPSLSALLFLLLTVFHFGMADATAVHADADGPIARWGLVFGRGLLLLSTVFAAHPAEAWAPFVSIGDALSPWMADAWQPDRAVLQGLAMIGVASGAVAALCSAAARGRAGQSRNAALDLVEHAIVVVLALAADPLFTVGCYFIGVHAFRHSRRLACTQAVIGEPTGEPNRDERHAVPGGIIARLVRVHVLSLPLMWLTALCLVPLWWLIGPLDAWGLAKASIAFYMITTLPHHMLGLRLPQPDMPPAGRDSSDTGSDQEARSCC
jgi:Brp/Blh family beta-carotene 15,15'-monooxygenase